MTKNIHKTQVIFTVALILIFFVSCSWNKNDVSYHSQILYRDDDYTDTTSAVKISHSTYIYDFETGATWVVVKNADLLPVGWSPSGTQLLFDGVAGDKARQVWVSNADGSNLRKVFDVQNYPELLDYFYLDAWGISRQQTVWFTDSVIVINNIFFDIETGKVERVENGQVITVSPAGGFWIERASEDQLNLLFSSGQTFPLASHNFRISPDGKKIAYTQEAEGKFSIFVSQLDDMRGPGSEKLLATLSGDSTLAWSPNGQYFLYVVRNSDDAAPPFIGRCVVLSASTGAILHDFTDCDYGGGNILWSPDSRGFLAVTYEQENYFYDLETGSKTHITSLGDNLPSGNGRFVIDWALIPLKAP